jgi:hypothetical protein
VNSKLIRTKIKRVHRLLAELARETEIETEFHGITFSEKWERGAAPIASIMWVSTAPDLQFQTAPDTVEDDTP